MSVWLSIVVGVLALIATGAGVIAVFFRPVRWDAESFEGPVEERRGITEPRQASGLRVGPQRTSWFD